MRRLSPREIVLLAVVAVAGIGYLWYASGKNAGTSMAGLTGDEAFERLAETAPVVPLGMLGGAADRYDTTGRDLFKYSKRPPTAEELAARRAAEEAARRAREEAERRRREALAEKDRQQEARKRTPPSGPPTPTGPRPPNITFKYIGYLGPQTNRIAVFQSGEELFLGRKGEDVKEDFKVVDIGYETVVMGYTDPQFEDRTRELPLSRR